MKIDVDVPCGVSGIWSVKDLTVGHSDMEGTLEFTKNRGVPAGTYKKLTRGDVVVMTNTPDEILDFRSFVDKASGSVLINGLGLGTIIKALLAKADVVSITVIENSIDVIKLVSPTYQGHSKITIIHDDAFNRKIYDEWYDFIWHDIWDTITQDNLSEMKLLKDKYSKISGYQECWCEDICVDMKRQNIKSFFDLRYK